MKFLLFGIVAMVVAIFFAYFAGVRVASEKCRAKQNADLITQHSQIIKVQGEINAQAVRRSSDDIRRVLHEKYTIAE